MDYNNNYSQNVLTHDGNLFIGTDTFTKAFWKISTPHTCGWALEYPCFQRTFYCGIGMADKM